MTTATTTDWDDELRKIGRTVNEIASAWGDADARTALFVDLGIGNDPIKQSELSFFAFEQVQAKSEQHTQARAAGLHNNINPPTHHHQTSQSTDGTMQPPSKRMKRDDGFRQRWGRIGERKSVEALMNAKKGDFALKSKSNFSHTADRNHDDATPIPIEGFDLSTPDVQRLKEERGAAYCAFSSSLIDMFYDFTDVDSPVQKVESYQSEADICNITSIAVRDAIKILVLEGEFEIGELVLSHERGLLGCRPDLMVVRGRDNVGLIAAEVKQPTESPLRSYSSVVGHAYDHAMAMKAFNVGTDIVLVTSFEQSFLGSLKAEDLNRSVHEGETVMEVDHEGSLKSAEDLNQDVRDDEKVMEVDHEGSLKSAEDLDQDVHDDETTRKTEDEGSLKAQSSAKQDPPGQKKTEASDEWGGNIMPSPRIRSFAQAKSNDAIDSLENQHLYTSTSAQMSQSQSPPQMKSPAIAPTVSKDSDSSPSSSLASDAPSLSPAKLDITRDTHESKPGRFTKDGTERVLYVSKENYEAHELVRLFYTALKISKRAYKDFQKKTYKLKLGERYLFPRALQVADQTDRWQWGELEATIGEAINVRGKKSNPRRRADGTTGNSSEGTFYIVGSLGQGYTSNVYQAINHLGELVAIKVFVKNTDEKDKVLEKSAFQSRAEAATEREKQELLGCYPFLEGKIHVIKICGFYALVMPIFEPIPKENREKRLDDVRTLVLNLKRRNKKYSPSDARWRHAGTFIEDSGTEHLVLFDLADLLDYNDTDWDDEYSSSNLKAEETDPVERQMNIFTQRCSQSSDDSPTDKAGFFADVIDKSE
eukprot:CAMPEP_0113445798 /NCGR_PEP_ID=MMETSP0014_2-20120614/3374_1 /TAXON_ID=2857 /ORGANISM="Nitzschia sp." /LENGTH=817 /DNA_ID=CAMNT_0000336865 /DNA_START=213 /DNA_END=2666 /DNA_ORIENTATION=+ /assembly_acc=CAM_ASM_000159